jgi:hypothetical protein
MTKPIGRRDWAIAEGYIPSSSHGPEPEMTSHETACLLNPGDQDAIVRITVFFSDREPAGPYRVSVPARRTRHYASTSWTIPSRLRGTPTTPA